MPTYRTKINVHVFFTYVIKSIIMTRLDDVKWLDFAIWENSSNCRALNGEMILKLPNKQKNWNFGVNKEKNTLHNEARE